jgi:restriction system protein
MTWSPSTSLTACSPSMSTSLGGLLGKPSLEPLAGENPLLLCRLGEAPVSSSDHLANPLVLARGRSVARASPRKMAAYICGRGMENRVPLPSAVGHYNRVNDLKIPNYHELMWPALQATKELGGSATVHEMNERVVESAGISEDQQAVPHKDGRMSEVEYRLHWARTHLKGIGALENSARGVWAVTDRGRSMSEPEMKAANKAWRNSFRERRAAQRSSQVAEAVGEDEEAAESNWEDQLIARLLQLPPEGFERLAQRILREAGFTNVTVTGKSGDGGIDGMGTYRLSLVSFPVYFQCKRYKGTVSAGTVRDFRGAMAGRGEKGLLITTGSFTRDAQAEATRDGASPVELIDGDRLCDLLKQYGLGVQVRTRVEEDVIVNESFFDEYQ